ncbi:hypothetical protein [Caulobacter sp. NIBR1757]|uniref:hypothetical protein n=1 Tax=Caulobacter sp. NIBR1757 TaxID=3016000 RepID=UPI0022F0BF5F|nr:hypothetical protein [Caulobacter sp. NIBR1757]WGM37521.1 hypothetical protein AMEJIAPC_00420 [Caulobacter sp. NIBR1757]
MTTFVFFADQGHKRRADGRNVAVAQGANVAVARAAAEALIGQPGAFADFAAVDISATVPPFVIEGHFPVGARTQTVWPLLTRGGDRLLGE